MATTTKMPKKKSSEQKRNRNCSDLLFRRVLLLIAYSFFVFSVVVVCCFFLACLVQFNVFMVSLLVHVVKRMGWLPFISSLRSRHSPSPYIAALSNVGRLCCFFEHTQMSLTFFSYMKNTPKKNAKILISTSIFFLSHSLVRSLHLN